MKRALIPALIAATLTLSACSSGSKPTAQPAPSEPAPPVATPAPAPTPDPPQPAPAEPAPAPEPVAPKPAIKWMPTGIGYPLASDDPEAKGKKVVMLTFDDGPSDTGTTAAILDVLAKENVKAMFFITGYGAKNIDLVERIHKEGHLLAGHTMSHPNLTTLPLEQIREEVLPVHAIIEQVTGEKPKYFRPPFGAYNELVRQVMQENGLELINWTNGSLDWEGTKDGYKDPNLVVQDVMSQLHPGAVVLFHDTLRHTAEALPEVIRQIRAEGYEFVVLP